MGTNWNETLIDNFIDSCAKVLHSILNDLITTHVPLKGVSKDTYPTWYSEELIRKIINTKILHKQWLEYGVMLDYILFKKLRSMCIRRSRIDRSAYMNE